MNARAWIALATVLLAAACGEPGRPVPTRGTPPTSTAPTTQVTMSTPEQTVLTTVPSIPPTFPDDDLELARWEDKPCEVLTDAEAASVGVDTEGKRERVTSAEDCVRSDSDWQLRYTLHIGTDYLTVKYLLPDRWEYFASAVVEGFPAVAVSKESEPTRACWVFVGSERATVEVELTSGQPSADICDRALAVANAIVRRVQE